MKKYIDDNSIPIEKVHEDCQLALKVKSNNLEIKHIFYFLSSMSKRFDHVKQTRTNKSCSINKYPQSKIHFNISIQSLMLKLNAR